MRPERSVYELLGVAPDVDQSVLKAAYRARVRVLHPDVGGTAEDYEELKLLNVLWGQVETPARRAAYDLSQVVEQERERLRQEAEGRRREREVAQQEARRQTAHAEARRRQMAAAAEAARRRYREEPRPGAAPHPGSPPPMPPPRGAAGTPAATPTHPGGVDWKGVGEVVADVFRSFVKRR